MNNIINKLKEKNIAILGFGKEGYSTYKYIRKHLINQKITILDKNEKILNSFKELAKDKNIEFILGDKYQDNLEIYDYVIKTPGIYLSPEEVLKLNNKLTSQMSLVLNETDAFIIGITGTKGKSTTSSLIYKVIKDQDKDVHLVGNIGNPILDYIDLVNENTILVAEFSAHQLQHIKKSPKIGIILNLFEEHLDYFKDVNKYFEAKLNMFKYQTENEFGIYFLDNDTLNDYIKSNKYKSKLTPVTFIGYDNDCMYADDNHIYKQSDKSKEIIYNVNDSRNLVGKHNIGNIMFVLKVVDILGLDYNKAINSINTFEGLEHRLKKVGTFNNIIFYCDTIATIPAATINGINSLGNVDTLIFGGMDRGIDYSIFAEDLLKTSITNFICMPETGYKIGNKLNELKRENQNIYFVEELEEAVKIAYKVTEKEKICLLSPAAPSYNRYKNYEEKGNYFIEYVKSYEEK